MKMSARSRHYPLLWVLAALLLAAGVYANAFAGQVAQPRDADTPAVESAAGVGITEGAAMASIAMVGVAQGTAEEAIVQESQVQEAPLQESPVQEAGGTALRELRDDSATPWYSRLVSVLGLGTMILLAWAMSANRQLVPWRIVAWGLGLQFVFALFILRTPVGALIFDGINDVIVGLLGYTQEGASFLFGNLVGNSVPVTTEAGATVGETALVAQTGAFFAFNVLPTIIFFSSLMTVLYHLGVMQRLVRGVAWVMMRTMKTSGAETLSSAGNIFMGQTEAPLLIKPFVTRMTNSELMAVMVGGFATVAGGVMAAYVGLLVGHFPDIAGHLLAASVMSAPAALLISKVMYPEDGEPVTRDSMRIEVEKTDANLIDAAARGAGEGLTLALNVGAMLLAFIALIALLNALLGWAADVTQISTLFRGWGWLADGQRLTLEVVMGWILAPLAWIMGVPWQDAPTIGSLLGVKTALNEFVAYLQLSNLLNEGAGLSPRSIVIATYALCGFANFSSIAIQIGGIGGIAPTRRRDLARLGLKAMIGGSLAAFMTATVAGILI